MLVESWLFMAMVFFQAKRWRLQSTHSISRWMKVKIWPWESKKIPWNDPTIYGISNPKIHRDPSTSPWFLKSYRHPPIESNRTKEDKNNGDSQTKKQQILSNLIVCFFFPIVFLTVHSQLESCCEMTFSRSLSRPSAPEVEFWRWEGGIFELPATSRSFRFSAKQIHNKFLKYPKTSHKHPVQWKM